MITTATIVVSLAMSYLSYRLQLTDKLSYYLDPKRPARSTPVYTLIQLAYHAVKCGLSVHESRAHLTVRSSASRHNLCVELPHTIRPTPLSHRSAQPAQPARPCLLKHITTCSAHAKYHKFRARQGVKMQLNKHILRLYML